MADIHITLPDKLDDDFRKKVGAEMGARKGSVNKAGQQAIELWTYGKVVTK